MSGLIVFNFELGVLFLIDSSQFELRVEGACHTLSFSTGAAGAAVSCPEIGTLNLLGALITKMGTQKVSPLGPKQMRKEFLCKTKPKSVAKLCAVSMLSTHKTTGLRLANELD